MTKDMFRKLKRLEDDIIRIAKQAEENGCDVRFDNSWSCALPYCNCADELHFSGQQSSYLSEESSQRRRLH